MNEQRLHNRTNFIEVVEMISDCGRLSTAFSKNISEGGIFVKDTSIDIGEEVILTFILGYSPVQHTARVIRKCEDGVALKFFDEFFLTNKELCL